jgi:hypothetical protein
MESTGPQIGVRVEIVTESFVAAGVPEGVRDIARLLENLNNPAISQQIALKRATLRPLYRAASPLVLDAPLLVRRDEIVFATFEGPQENQHEVDAAALSETPCLMMAPPFQIQGDVAMQVGAERTQALHALMSTFFPVRDARVYDAEGYLLGEGQQIIVNGPAVQMASPTRRHIEAFAEKAGQARRNASEQQAAEEDAPAAEAMRAA